MTTRAVERVEEWSSEPFPGGYAALHDLADEEFSGIVQVGLARLCMTGGTAVGILDGDIEDFEDEGTTYEAPSPALPLLALMQERNDEVKAKYYTEDTPISEVDGTLSDGKFSGYIELSENVLSGDYYLVYHAGRSMAVAFVGNSKQLLTDDEAFDRADGEVGIYEVRPAEVDPIEIPEPTSDRTSASTTAPDEAAGSGESGSSDPDDAESEAGDTADATGDAPRSESTRSSGPGAADEATSEPAGATGTDSTAEATGTDSTADATESGSVTETESAASASGASESEPATDADSSAGETTDARPATDADADTTPTGRGDAPGEDSGEDAGSSGSTRRRDESDTTEASDTASGEEREGRASGDAADESSATERASGAEPPSSQGERSDAGQHGGSAVDANRGRGGGRRDSQPGSAGGPRSTGEPAESGPAGGGYGTPEPETGTGGDTGSVTSPDQLEKRSIPSLDPSRSSSSRDGGASAVGGAGVGGKPGQSPGSQPSAGSADGREREPRTGRDTRASPSDSGGRSDASAGGRSTDRAGDRADTRTGQNAETSESAPPDGAGATRTDRPDAEPDRSSGGAQSEPGATSEPRSGASQSQSDADARVSELESEIDDLESQLDEVESELAEVEAEREDLRDERNTLREERDSLREERDELRDDLDALERERDDLQAEVDSLEEEVESLESQLEQFESQFGAATDTETRLTPQEALDQTNLFIRYESKGRATLETAHDGNASRDEVNENLGLEYHTQFDAASAAVGGQTFDEFLTDTIQYRFVTWVINHLLYEIRDTGKIAEMQDLYDAIPRIDRAELNGEITAEFTEDGQERRTQESFDVVLRDRMGNALMVANLNDSRQAATENMMTSLVTASSRVGESTETLAASFLVTSSFFEPEALETASEATSGGLLSRDKRESFVKLTRKQGYHLCLVEAREGQFHLAVPEL